MLGKFGNFDGNVTKLLWSQLFAALGNTFWGLFFNLYLDSMGFEKARIGNILALGNVAVATFAIPVAIACVRGNLKNFVFMGQLVSALFYFLALFVGKSDWLLLFVFLASGFGTLPSVALAPLLLRNSSETQRSYVFSAYFFVLYIGGILGLTGGGTLKQHLSILVSQPELAYRFSIALGLIFSLISVVPAAFVKEERRLQEKSVSWRDVLKLDFAFLAKALLPIVLIGTGAGVIIQFMNLFFKDSFSLPDNIIGYLMAAMAVATAVGTLLAPIVADRFGGIFTVVVTQMMSIPFMVAMGFTRSPVVASICFVLRGMLMNMAGPVSHSLMMSLAKRDEQLFFNALVTCVRALTWAFAAWLYGHVLRGSYMMSFLLAAALYGVASVLYYVFFKGAEQSIVERGAVRGKS